MERRERNKKGWEGIEEGERRGGEEREAEQRGRKERRGEDLFLGSLGLCRLLTSLGRQHTGNKGVGLT